ncbi:hypothetical protein [Ferrimonas lipolytica]|uniref:Phage shock protein B n=1 Tax=Ferrimonas lipolytica TaxID=2724191 RepID=A0A6H1UFY8_9GAMM|nr:hypothetical protein [Ferrimonas lipolytica]QIZ77738.1 hypothetical protein HER31_13025 [Ferrimonas lipolytica]
MEFWTAIVVIVAISTVMGVIPQIMKERNRSRANKQNTDLEQRLAQLESHNEQLMERVEVLERIVTDGNYDLQQQFQKLG